MRFVRFSRPGIAFVWLLAITTATLNAQTEPKVAIVLSGGAAKGSFEVGALRFLYEAQHITANIITGTSVGAINAAMLAEGGSYEDQREALSQLENVWFSLNTDRDMYVKSKCFADLEYTAKKAYRDINSHIEGCKEAVNELEVWDAGDCYWLATYDFEAILGNIVTKAQRCDSLFTLEPIRAKLSAHLSEAAVHTSGVQLRLATVSLESGRMHYATEAGLLVPAREYHPKTALREVGGLNAPSGMAQRVSILNAVMASAAIPGVFRPEPLGNAQEHFIDGGVRDIAPLDAALVLRPDVMYVIEASPLTMGKWIYPGKTPGAGFAMPSILLRTTDIMVSENTFGDLARLGQATEQITENGVERVNPLSPGNPVKLTVIHPEVVIHDGMMIDPGLIRIAIGYGYLKAADVVLRGKWPSAEEISKERKTIWVKERQLRHLQQQAINPGGKTPELAQRLREAAKKKIPALYAEIDKMKEKIARMVNVRRGENERSVPPAISEEWDPKVWWTYWERQAGDRGQRRRWEKVDPQVVR